MVLLRRALQGDAWHGPSLQDALAGVDAGAASAHPIEGAHSIWEIVLHVGGWAREVAKRLRGGEPTTPVQGDWPTPEATTEEAWAAARDELRAIHEELLSAVGAFPKERLNERVGGDRDAPLGTGVSYLEMIDGVLQHDAYHTGQISLLKKARLAR
ncbi:MAG: DinB family protein [Vicinamibacteria bacterium]